MFLFLEALGVGKLASRLIVIGAIVLALVAAWFAWTRYLEGVREEGREEVRAEWREKNAAAAVAAERAGRDALIHMERTSADYVSRKAAERAVTRTIVERVPVYVPVVEAPIAALPRDHAVQSLAGIVLLHDAAVAGADPGATPDPGALEAAGAVVPRHFGGVLVSNIGECRNRGEQIDALITAYEGLVEIVEKLNVELEAIRRGAPK